jgi:anti-sigma factor RsiW
MRERCRISRYLTAYADNELAERSRRRVEKHLSICAGCTRELDSIRASDRILKRAVPPAVSDDRWALFRRDLSQAMDDVDREARRSTRIREVRPVLGTARRWTFATAGVCAALILAVLTLGPMGYLPWWNGVGNECIVESIETYAAGYTPMFFKSQDPEMTVIWVFAEEVEGGMGGERPSAR